MTGTIGVITPRALRALVECIREGEMVFVHTLDNLGHPFTGRVMGVDGATFDVETSEGEMVFSVLTSHIQRVDVLPFRRFSTRPNWHYV